VYVQECVDFVVARLYVAPEIARARAQRLQSIFNFRLCVSKWSPLPSDQFCDFFNTNTNDAPLPMSTTERRAFLEALRHFMIERCTPIERVPVFDRTPLDLHGLYLAVTTRGGLQNVIDKKLWRYVVEVRRWQACFWLARASLSQLFFFAVFCSGCSASESALV
jgi:hypothetical protein